jgi:hypothetical protein
MRKNAENAWPNKTFLKNPTRRSLLFALLGCLFCFVG